MNEPKRLLAESQSSLAHELLLAARGERVSNELRLRMSDGLALTLGVTSLGAGLTLGGHASGAVAGIAASGLAGAGGGVTAGTNLAALGAGSGGALASSGSALTTSAGAALWLKGVLAVSVLTGAVGLGSAVTHWLAPVEAPSSASATGLASPAAVAPARALQDGLLVAPGDLAGAPETAVPRVAAPTTDVAAPIELERGSRKVRSKGKAASTPATTSSDLDREVRLLDAARRAILAGDINGARERLAQYSRTFPQGALRGEAASLARAAASAQ